MKKDTSKANKKTIKLPAFVSICQKQYSRIEHYKSGERATVWIKLYLDLLEDFEFCILPDETKFHFIGLMILAAKNFNRLPTDSKFLMQKLSATSEINLETLLKNGLIIPAKRMQIKRKFASTEQEQEKNRTEEEKEQQQTGKQEKLFVVSPFKSKCSLEEIGAYEAHCRATGTIEKPPAFRKYLESGKADKEISDFLENRANAGNGNHSTDEAEEDTFARIGARPKRN